MYNMGNFIKQSSFSRYYHANDELNILNLGYDDFSVVEPLRVFRTQNFYTWHFVISGSGTLEIYDKKYNVKSGEMFFIPPDTKMRYYPNSQEPWEYVWFSFNGDKVTHYGEQVGFCENNPVCSNKNFKRTNQALKRLFDMLINDECGYFRVLSAFYEIIDISAQYHSLTEIQQVRKLIDENFVSPNFSIEQLCRDVGISHIHLLRLFKNAYGETLIKYVLSKKIELACELLLSTDLSVGSVAYSCGFRDESHFMKTFKKSVGVSALQYRKNSTG